MNRSIYIVFSVALLATYFLGACQTDGTSSTSSVVSSAVESIPDKIDFNFHVKPILSDRCFNCHGPDLSKMEAGLAFHTKESAFALLGENKDHYAIVPGNVDSSHMIDRIYSEDEDVVMPPPASNLVLEPHEKEILKRWIEQGAEWKEHWAFTAPTQPELPTVGDESWIQNDIDHFILQKIEEQGMTVSEKEDKHRLLRRVTFDLTGLPPSETEIEQFINDDSDRAFEKVVDRLLTTQAHAERLAVDWLDLARYADTNGYQDDFERFNWPWRDWVIHAFKKNMPYDEFVTWQIAGDLLPDPTLEQTLATGFNRNHKITNEGGVIPEEYRVEYVSDRTNTFGTAFLGLTMECAKCHDHKYDPITQKNYYELYSFFNNVPEEGFVGNGQDPKPVIVLTEKEVEEHLQFITSLDTIDEVRFMVMEEMEEPRQAHILNRGEYDKPTDPVNPNTPDFLSSFEGYEKNRKGLAEWLFDENNALTARVAVNRMWQQIFGNGIVASSFDFGNQGSLPSHPELLDYLAIKFKEDKWDMRAMYKFLVMSATYQQSSKTNVKYIEEDPENRWLTHAPRLRLPAEMIRDHALKISDLLVAKVGGPSVKPYQPSGLWQETTGGGGGSTARYMADEGEGLYRRSLYTFWKRTVPPPSMMTFDAASRDLCSVKRQNTSTPLQALVMMNDPQMIEASRMLAYKSIKKFEDGPEDRIRYMFELATSRTPSEMELGELSEYFNSEYSRFENDEEAADEFLDVGNFQMSSIVEKYELAAYTAIASTIMNLDETITRG